MYSAVLTALGRNQRLPSGRTADIQSDLRCDVHMRMPRNRFACLDVGFLPATPPALSTNSTHGESRRGACILLTTLPDE